MTDTDLIAQADAALDGVTPGPWTFKIAANGDCGITAPGCSVVAETFADIRHSGEGAREEAKANAYFMLHARQLVPALRDALAAALDREDDEVARRQNAEDVLQSVMAKLDAERARVVALEAAIQAAIDCGMVPKSSAKEGGANKYSEYVRVADMLRAALTGEPQP